MSTNTLYRAEDLLRSLRDITPQEALAALRIAAVAIENNPSIPALLSDAKGES